jgi:peptidoglycan hydrolase CwlO-like protein
MKVEKLLGCFPKLVWTAVQGLVKEKDAMANWIQELEEKRSSLEKECQESQYDIIHLRREVQLLQVDVDSIKREHDQLQDLGRLQKEENEQLARQLKNAKTTLALEEGIQKSLAVAAEAATMILETEKVELIQKDLEHLYQGEAQSFEKLLDLPD